MTTFDELMKAARLFVPALPHEIAEARRKEDAELLRHKCRAVGATDAEMAEHADNLEWLYRWLLRGRVDKWPLLDELLRNFSLSFPQIDRPSRRLKRRARKR